MHPLHDGIARLLTMRLEERSVVVWYDPRAEFQGFVDELRGVSNSGTAATPVTVGGATASLVQFAGSMFELRAVVEPLVGPEKPERVILYLPGCERDATGSVLMEIEKAGDCWVPQLRQLARNVLRRNLTDGVIDELLVPETLNYADLALATSDAGSGETPSVLKTILRDAAGADGMLASWLADERFDAEVQGRGATRELARLIQSRLGLELPDGMHMAKARAATLRYVLGGEFRSDLAGQPPASLEAVPAPRTKGQETAIRDLAQRLRTQFAGTYETIADRIAEELQLSAASVTAEALGTIDTFRFEERVLLSRCGDLVTNRRFEDALELVSQSEQSFWLDRDVARRAQWEAIRLMAELGRAANEVLASVRSAAGDPGDWVERYVAEDGWHRLDQAQRRLETWIRTLEDEPPERALALVRWAYEDASRAMADGFTAVLAKADWTVPGPMPQTHVYGQVVAVQPGPVAYFLVDAMRYEMGVELASRLPQGAEVRVRPAIAALPTVTSIGMAALLPGASASFDVVAEGGKLGARIEDVFLPNLAARRRFAEARIPNLLDLTLGDVLTWSKGRLASRIEGARVIIVRSQEIDDAGERGFAHQARQVMDSAIADIPRALRRLADAGVERAVLAADHGHLFSHEDRDESMRIKSPGGETVELHRRCWIGRGGATPAGCVRVSAGELGYVSDLEFVFLPGTAVFNAAGDLAYHHGGPSLQELVIPVITVRSPAPRTAAAPPASERLSVPDAPAEITNRIFSVTIELGGPNLALFPTPEAVQPVLISEGRQVGSIGMAIGEEVDTGAGTVRLQAGRPLTVAFLLSDDTVRSVRIVVRDPATDAELYRSPSEIPVRLGVA